MNGLIAYQCKNCGQIMNPKHSRCRNCHGREFDPIAPAGQAKLISFTEVCTLPWGIDERCRILGIVEFENQVRAMGLVKVAEPKPGMKLEAKWEPVRVMGGEPVYGLTLEAAK